MISYLYMKLLETQPRRYDFGLSLLSLGAVGRVRRLMVDRYLAPGMRVLDIGAGTGSLARIMAAGGMEVVGLDSSPEMLAVARERTGRDRAAGRVTLIEAGVAEMDRLFADSEFDAVTACLVLSELSPDELRFTIDQARRVLREGGRLVVADEFRPKSLPKLVLYHLIRFPVLVVTFLLTQTLTHPLPGPDSLMGSGGFDLLGRWTNWSGSFRIIALQRTG